ncbi:MAG: hypothetical protein ABEI06_02190 [Halobacteriaceae archaeon]
MVEELNCSDQLSDELQTLKRTGANLLVVSAEPEEKQICSQLLGAKERTRRCLFVPTTVGVNDILDRYRNQQQTKEFFGIININTNSSLRVSSDPENDMLNMSFPSAEIDSDQPWYTEIQEMTDLPAITEAVQTHLEHFQQQKPNSSEVRFCLESIDPYVDALEEEALFRFLLLLTASIRNINGIGHHHVSTAVPYQTRKLIQPLYDATIEVKRETGHLRQRWRLHDAGIETHWMPVEG